MDAISLGPLTITVPMLIGMLSAAAGMLVHHLAVRRLPEAETLGALAVNTLLVWLIGWKLSPVLFDPASFRGLLYWQGGERALWTASAAAAVYLLYAGRRKGVRLPAIARSALSFGLGFAASRYLLLLIWGEGSRLTHGLLALLAAAALLRLLVRRGASGARSPELQLAILFGAGFLLVTSLGDATWERRELEAAAGAAGLRVGQLAPDLSLTDLDGRAVRLSDYREKTVVLNFWATWCPPCRAEMPELQKFYERYRDSDVVLLAVNATSTEAGADDVRRWLAKREYTMPVPADPAGDASALYRIRVFPTTYVIGPDGAIRGKHYGPMNLSLLEEAVR